MHSEIVMDGQRNCSECGMILIPLKERIEKPLLTTAFS